MGKVELRVIYGVMIDPKDAPWSKYKYDDSENHAFWWREINGFKPTFNIYDRNGNCVDGVSDDDPRVDLYYKEVDAWNRVNPIPFDLEYGGVNEGWEVFVCARDGQEYWDRVELSKVTKKARIDPNTQRAFCDFIKMHIGDVKPTWWLVCDCY